jgi:integrase
LPVFVGLTGLRCSEWLALEWGDVDRRAGVVHVRRVFTDGRVKLYGKQTGSLRTVPLSLKPLRGSPSNRHAWIRLCSFRGHAAAI